MDRASASPSLAYRCAAGLSRNTAICAAVPKKTAAICGAPTATHWASSVDEVVDRLVEPARSSGDVGPKGRGHQFENEWIGAEALSGGEGLLAQRRGELPVVPCGCVGGGRHERDRGAGMLAGIR